MGKLFEGVIVGWLVSLVLTIPAVLIPVISLTLSNYLYKILLFK